LTAKTRRRVSPIIDPALLPWIQNAYIQKQGSTTGLEFNALGFIDTTLLQYDTNHTTLCVTPKPQFDLFNSQIKRGLNSQWATPNPNALGWNYCTTISADDNLDNNLENGFLVIRADSLRLHPVKIMKPALAGSSVVLLSLKKEIVQNYVGANRLYELYATYPSTHLVDSFSVGGSPIATFANYSTYAGSQSFYYNSTVMKPATNDTIEVKYIYRERRKYALAIDPAFKAVLDTAWISDRKSATIYPWFTVPEFTEGVNLPTICMVPKLGVTVNSVLFDTTLVSSYFMNISLTGIPARTICADLGMASTLRSATEAGTILQVRASTTGTPITP